MRIVAFLLAFWCHWCAPLNVAKLGITNFRLINQTSQSQSLAITLAFDDTQESTYQDMPLTIAAGKEATIFFDGTLQPGKVGHLHAITHNETGAIQRLQAKQQDQLWELTLVKPHPACISFSFVPPMVDFMSALQVRPREIPLPTRMKLLTREYITQPLEHTLLLERFKFLYEQHKDKMSKPDDSARIPKIIHQVWLKNPLPEKYKRYIATWLKNHPGWKYCLWTDHASDPCPTFAAQYQNYTYKMVTSFESLQNQHLYDKARNPAEKSDILRYEIIERFGGVYVDCDVECFEPLDILHHAYDFYGGIEPVECGHLVGNALFGAKPNHPILHACIAGVRAPQDCPQARRFGQTMMTVCATGPMVLSAAVYTAAGRNGNRDITLPTSYFYPCGLRRPQASPKPESFAAHYWTLAWAGVKR